METIEYTELWVRDGLAFHFGGQSTQYWVAINRLNQTKVDITTYDGDTKGAQVIVRPLTPAAESKVRKKFTLIDHGTMQVPECFKKIEISTPTEEIAMPPQEESARIKLEHTVLRVLTFDEIDELSNLDKFNTFVGRVDTIATRKHPVDEDARNKIKGDIFELFVEFLLKSKGTDAHTGVIHYQVADPTMDLGIDGYGISVKNGRPMTVQVKYRTYDHVLKSNEDRLSNFLGQSLIHFGKQGFFPLDSANMLIITSAREVNYKVDEIFDKKCRYLCNEQLRSMTDGLNGFWQMFHDAMMDGRAADPTKAPKGKALREHQLEAVAAVMANIDGQTSPPPQAPPTIAPAEEVRVYGAYDPRTGLRLETSGPGHIETQTPQELVGQRPAQIQPTPAPGEVDISMFLPDRLK